MFRQVCPEVEGWSLRQKQNGCLEHQGASCSEQQMPGVESQRIEDGDTCHKRVWVGIKSMDTALECLSELQSLRDYSAAGMAKLNAPLSCAAFSKAQLVWFCTSTA